MTCMALAASKKRVAVCDVSTMEYVQRCNGWQQAGVVDTKTSAGSRSMQIAQTLFATGC